MFSAPDFALRPRFSTRSAAADLVPAPRLPAASASPVISVTCTDRPDDMRCWLQSRCQPRRAETATLHRDN